MVTLMAISLFLLLMVGCPFLISILFSLILSVSVYLPDLKLTFIVQQMLTGMTPQAIVCIPMFILAANIATAGEAAKRLIIFVKALIGHIPGGLPITTNASCTIFGAVSGSCQATVAAIGKTMRPMLLEAGYPSSFTLGLIINSSDIALLIPPSVGMIVYGVATRTSIGQLFLAGIGPGLLVFTLFSLYSLIYSRYKNIGRLEKASRKERVNATINVLPLLGFPAIIIGGIYSGSLSPTEAAASTVFYALILECLVYKSLSFKKFRDITLETGLIAAVILVLVGAGQAIIWILSFCQIPQTILPHIFGVDPSPLKVILVINLIYFVACMFIDQIVAIFILSPLFMPYVNQAGIDPVLLGALVTMQVAIGSATPPCGCDIFTAQVIFRRPYLEVISHTAPFILLLLFSCALILIFPEIALFLPKLAFGN